LPVYGADTWREPELLQTAGLAAEGAFFVAPQDYYGAEYQAFAAAYRKRYAKEPDFNASNSYDAAHVAALAVDKVLRDGQPVNGETLARALPAVEFHGATGTTRFNENGEVRKPFGRYVYRNGVVVNVD
jgi:branched-chain amino acid transport system substrate-binding protein